jgi:hypothetical protein
LVRQDTLAEIADVGTDIEDHRTAPEGEISKIGVPLAQFDRVPSEPDTQIVAHPKSSQTSS